MIGFLELSGYSNRTLTVAGTDHCRFGSSQVINSLGLLLTVNCVKISLGHLASVKQINMIPKLSLTLRMHHFTLKCHSLPRRLN